MHNPRSSWGASFEVLTSTVLNLASLLRVGDIKRCYYKENPILPPVLLIFYQNDTTLKNHVGDTIKFIIITIPQNYYSSTCWTRQDFLPFWNIKTRLLNPQSWMEKNEEAKRRNFEKISDHDTTTIIKDYYPSSDVSWGIIWKNDVRTFLNCVKMLRRVISSCWSMGKSWFFPLEEQLWRFTSSSFLNSFCSCYKYVWFISL